MWSPYWPQWLLSGLALFLSPIKSLLLPRVPETYRTAAVYAASLFATFWVVLFTPMGWRDLVPQAALLWGMVLTGYVAAKSNLLWAPAAIYTGAEAASKVATVAGLILVPQAFGQDPTTAEAAKDIAIGQATQWFLWFLTILGGKLGRATDNAMAKRRTRVQPVTP